jgi:putative photosynthetic complex assembly protein 2
MAALAGLAWSAGEATATGSFVGFTAALAVWGWNELGFLLGLVTGPRREPLAPGSGGGARLSQAIQAILYHELAIAVSAALVLAATWGGENQVGAWTFLLLWVMRVSAKLNVFLGVPNLGEDFLPDHLGYLASFFRRRPMNPLFPVSVSAATASAVLLAQAALAPGTDPGAAVGFALLFALLALALLEHWLMVLPIPSAPLWGWFLKPRLGVAAPPPPSP